MGRDMELIERKAQILIDALPYLRDFNQKIIIIGYTCSDVVSGDEEQEIMRDITLMQSVGMKCVIVHDTRMGMDKFRENKRIAKLVELCGTKAIGICGVDPQTLQITIDNGYIPVITPNDIDTEHLYINPIDTAREVAELLKAEKLIYIGREAGLFDDEGNRITSMTVSELKDWMRRKRPAADIQKIIDNVLQALEKEVERVHMLSGKLPHALLLELFSIVGVGTVFMTDERRRYLHEMTTKKSSAS